MIDSGLCRRTVSQRVARVVRLFRFAVENEFVPPAVHHALKAVPGLARGRSGAKEGRAVKPGTKHTLMVDPHGVPPAIRTAGGNAGDHKQIVPLVSDFPDVGGVPGRWKELPDDADADRGYDSEATRAPLLRWLASTPLDFHDCCRYN